MCLVLFLTVLLIFPLFFLLFLNISFVHVFSYAVHFLFSNSISFVFLKAAQDEVTRKKPTLETIKEDGDWLIRHNSQDATLKDVVNEIVDKDEDKYDKFVTKVEIRRDRLLKALSKCQEFHTNFNDFTTSLDDLEKKIQAEEPLTVRFEPLKKQKEEHEVLISFLYHFPFLHKPD